MENRFEYIYDIKISGSSGRGSISVAGLFQFNSKVPRAGFEPATTRSSAGCSPKLSYFGSVSESCLIMSLSFSRFSFRVTSVLSSNYKIGFRYGCYYIDGH